MAKQGRRPEKLSTTVGDGDSRPLLMVINAFVSVEEKTFGSYRYGYSERSIKADTLRNRLRLRDRI